MRTRLSKEVRESRKIKKGFVVMDMCRAAIAVIQSDLNYMPLRLKLYKFSFYCKKN